MAKFEEVFDDTQALFDKVLSECNLEQNVNVKILANNTLKQIGKVVKANDLLKHMTSEDVIVLLNEKVFEKLEEEQKHIVVDELLAQVYFDSESGKVSLVKPDVNTFSLLLVKYGYSSYERLQETIKSAFSKVEEETAPQS